MYLHTLAGVRRFMRRSLYVIQALMLLVGGFLPLVLSARVSATQLTTRSATIDKPFPNGTRANTNVQFIFAYTMPTTTQTVQSLTYNFCTTAVGACTLPTGLSARAASTHVSQTGFPTNATAFTVKNTATDSNNCLQSTGAGSGASFACYSRTAAGTGGGALTHTIAGITAPSTAQTVYVRIAVYSDTAYTTLVDSGTVAVSFNNALTVNAQVSEVLTFCVSATPIDNATSSIGTTCSGGSSINLGNVSNTAISVSPVSVPNGGDANNAYAQVTTNGQSGVVVGYQAVQDTSSGKLKVVGATCSGTSTTDQCFNSQGASQGTFTAGTENFGFTIAGTNCADVPAAAYTCAYASGNNNLKAVAGYQGGGATGSNTIGTPWTYGSANGYAFVDTTGSYTTIASSSTIVSTESLVLKYAATAQVSTPTGVYQAQQDFLATPTF